MRLIALILAALLVLAACESFDNGPVYSVDTPTILSPVVAVVGDLQPTGLVETWRENNDTLRRPLLRNLAIEDPDALVLVGDMVWAGSSFTQWRTFDTLMSAFRRRGTPMFPLLGNHEYIGVHSMMVQRIQRRFPHVTEKAYVRVIDSIAFVMLNTNFQEIGKQATAEELAWFRSEIPCLDDADSVKAIVVCGHHPPFTNSTVVSDDAVLKRYFVPSFLRASKTVLWFSGHCHAYEHFSAYGKHWITTGGGGGPRQELRTGSAQRHADLFHGAPIRPLHYCLVQRSGDDVAVTMRALDPITKLMQTAETFSARPSVVVPVSPVVSP